VFEGFVAIKYDNTGPIMAEKQIPLNAIPVLHALARSHGAASFADIKERTGLSQATVNRILNQLCEFDYAIKIGHGQYTAGPELLDLGLEVARNQILPRFDSTLRALRRKTQLNAELYVITPIGPVFLTHSPAKNEAVIPFRFGKMIGNRDAHPAALFYLSIHKGQHPEGCQENFIVDRGGQWPELFRAASMVRNSHYCLALSGLLMNVGEERHAELKEALHKSGAEMELP